jgi:hypothetical protein
MLSRSILKTLVKNATADNVGNENQSNTIQILDNLNNAKITLMNEVIERNVIIENSLKYDSITIKEQAAAVEIIERELVRIEKRLRELTDIRDQKNKLNKLNIYYAKSYVDHVRLMKLVIIFIVALFSIRTLIRIYPIPDFIKIRLYLIVIVAGIISVGFKAYDISRRDKMDYDKYKWREGPLESSLGKPSDESDINKTQFLWGDNSDASNADCKNEQCCDKTLSTWDSKSRVCKPAFLP